MYGLFDWLGLPPHQLERRRLRVPERDVVSRRLGLVSPVPGCRGVPVDRCSPRAVCSRLRLGGQRDSVFALSRRLRLPVAGEQCRHRVRQRYVCAAAQRLCHQPRLCDLSRRQRLCGLERGPRRDGARHVPQRHVRSRWLGRVLAVRRGGSLRSGGERPEPVRAGVVGARWSRGLPKLHGWLLLSGRLDVAGPARVRLPAGRLLPVATRPRCLCRVRCGDARDGRARDKRLCLRGLPRRLVLPHRRHARQFASLSARPLVRRRLGDSDAVQRRHLQRRVRRDQQLSVPAVSRWIHLPVAVVGRVGAVPLGVVVRGGQRRGLTVRGWHVQRRPPGPQRVDGLLPVPPRVLVWQRRHRAIALRRGFLPVARWPVQLRGLSRGVGLPWEWHRDARRPLQRGLLLPAGDGVADDERVSPGDVQRQHDADAGDRVHGVPRAPHVRPRDGRPRGDAAVPGGVLLPREHGHELG